MCPEDVCPAMRDIVMPLVFGVRGGFPSAVSKLCADSGRQTLVDNDFEHELCGSEIRIDGFKPANSIVDLSRF